MILQELNVMLIRTLYFEQASIIAAVVCSLIVAGLLKETGSACQSSRCRCCRCYRRGYGPFPRTAQADAVSDRGPSGEPEQYASRTASLIRAFRAGASLAK